MRARTVLPLLVALSLAACGPRPSTEQRAQALAAFATVQQVFQHPRCQNCHIPGDAPLQFDAGVRHAMGVMRGPRATGRPDCGAPPATANPTHPRATARTRRPARRTGGFHPPSIKWPGSASRLPSCARPSRARRRTAAATSLRCSSTSARTSWCFGAGTRAAGARRCRYRTKSSSPSSSSGRQPAGRVRATSSTHDLLATCGPRSIFEGNSDAMNPAARCRADRPGLEGSKSRNRLSETLAWPSFFLDRR